MKATFQFLLTTVLVILSTGSGQEFSVPHPPQHTPHQPPLLQPPPQPPLVFQTPVSQPSSEEPSPVLNPFRADPNQKLIHPLKEDVHLPHSDRVLASAQPAKLPSMPAVPFSADPAPLGASGSAPLVVPLEASGSESLTGRLVASADSPVSSAAPLVKPAGLSPPPAGLADLAPPPPSSANLAVPEPGSAAIVAPSAPLASEVKNEPLSPLASNTNTANLDMLSDSLRASAVLHEPAPHEPAHTGSPSPVKPSPESVPVPSGVNGSRLPKWKDYKSGEDLLNENLYNEVQSSIQQMEKMRQSGAQPDPSTGQVQGNIVQRTETGSPVVEENSVLENLSASRVQEAALDDKLGMELLGIVEQIQDMQREVADALKD